MSWNISDDLKTVGSKCGAAGWIALTGQCLLESVRELVLGLLLFLEADEIWQSLATNTQTANHACLLAL